MAAGHSDVKEIYVVMPIFQGVKLNISSIIAIVLSELHLCHQSTIYLPFVDEPLLAQNPTRIQICFIPIITLFLYLLIAV